MSVIPLEKTCPATGLGYIGLKQEAGPCETLPKTFVSNSDAVA